jgi:Methyltransferase FkbM domain
MLPASWKPVPTDDLVRLGAPLDGGYVVSRRSVAASTMLLSMGLNDDWRFESEFRAQNGASVHCYDHTVTPRFWMLNALKQAVLLRFSRVFQYFRYRQFFRDDVVHHRVKIGYDGHNETSLDSIISKLSRDKIFLKVDIEGSEYRILDSVLKNAHRFTAAVFEFHDVDLHRHRIIDFISRFKEFSIVAVNGNNFGGVDSLGDPLVLEVSFVRNEFLAVGGSDVLSPLVAPVPNDPRRQALTIDFAAIP